MLHTYTTLICNAVTHSTSGNADQVNGFEWPSGSPDTMTFIWAIASATQSIGINNNRHPGWCGGLGSGMRVDLM